MVKKKKMKILARGIGRRKEAVAQIQILKGTGQFIINNLPADQYLHSNTPSILSMKSPLHTLKSLTGILNTESPAATDTHGNHLSELPVEQRNSTEFSQTHVEPLLSESSAPGEGVVGHELWSNMDTIVKVKGGGLVGQAEAIKLGLARALCELTLHNLEAVNPANVSPVSSLKLEGKGEPIIHTNESSTDFSVLLNTEEIKKQFKDKGYLTQDSRVKERRKYGLKKARKATQYNKR